MKRWTFFGVGAMMVSMAALISGCDNSDMPASEDENLSAESRSVISLSDSELSIVPAVNDFGVSMFAAYLGRGYDSANNVSFAPVSMAMCLGMLANGKDDEAREDLFDVIGVDRSRIGDFNLLMKKLVDGLPDSDSKNKLMMANGIWVGNDIDLQPSYPGFVDEYY
ncbi:MAG: entry exclusion lipoprotein TrbK, partial [Paramuribaculum sp.]|nr:entry exclusion lipoprotein TrbK [Paramuribaculum sp.]